MIDTAKYTPNTQLYIKNVEAYLKEKYGEIKPSWIGLLDSLAFQYDLFQLAKVGIEENGLVTQTNRGMAAMSAWILYSMPCSLLVTGMYGVEQA